MSFARTDLPEFPLESVREVFYPGEVFDGLCKASAAAQPTKGAFGNPSLGQHHEPLGDVGAHDDFQVPGPELANRRSGGGPLVAAVDEHPHDKGKEAVELFENWQHHISILTIGGLDVGRQDHLECVDDKIV